MLMVGPNGKPVPDVQSLKAEDLKQKAHGFLDDLVVRAANVVSVYVKQAGESQELGNELISSQISVIDLQQQLIRLKDDQIKSVTSVVEDKLGEVKQEVRNYSAALRSGVSSDDGVAQISHAEVKSAERPCR